MKKGYLLCILLFLSNCSSKIDSPREADFLEDFLIFEKEAPETSFNKAMLDLNFFLDDFLLKPMATIYKTLCPNVIRTLIGNFTDHLKIPFYIINDILQGDLKQASRNIWVFSFNTFAGVGLFNTSRYVDMYAVPNDMGKTLYSWGVESGPFLILPIIGPTYLRDAVGSGIAIFTDPINTTLSYQGYNKAYYGITAVSVIHKRSKMFENIEFLKKSYDPYSVIKSIYEQNRTTELGISRK